MKNSSMTSGKQEEEQVTPPDWVGWLRQVSFSRQVFLAFVQPKRIGKQRERSGKTNKWFCCANNLRKPQQIDQQIQNQAKGQADKQVLNGTRSQADQKKRKIQDSQKHPRVTKKWRAAKSSQEQETLAGSQEHPAGAAAGSNQQEHKLMTNFVFHRSPGRDRGRWGKGTKHWRCNTKKQPQKQGKHKREEFWHTDTRYDDKYCFYSFSAWCQRISVIFFLIEPQKCEDHFKKRKRIAFGALTFISAQFLDEFCESLYFDVLMDFRKLDLI